MFPDFETLIMDLLADLVGGQAHTGDQTPADLYDQLPFIRVNRYGGSDDQITDYPLIDVGYFASTRMAAWTMAQTGHQRLLGFPHWLDGGLIDRVITRVGPSKLPWDDDRIRFFQATYEMSGRRTN